MKLQKKMWGIILLTLGILVAVIATAIGLNFSVDFKVAETELTLEYQEVYEEKVPEANLVGKYFAKSGKKLEVQTEGKIDTNILGEQKITYRASYLWWSKTVTKTAIVIDSTAPVITLQSTEGYYVLPGGVYEEEGVLAIDNYDGDLTEQVVVTQEENTMLYTVKDSSGNETKATRPIPYHDPIPPEITLKGEGTVRLNMGDTFTDPGYTASDNLDGDLTEKVTVSGSVDTRVAGTYVLTYSVTDSFGNETKVQRQVVIKSALSPTPLPPNGKTIYLTFDDGPGPYTQELLNTLAKYNVKATFFVVSGKYNHLMKNIVDGGHAIGMHSMTHNYAQIYSSTQAFYDDLFGIQDVIYQQTGVKSTLMRFPGGSSNGVSKKYCKGIMSELTKSTVASEFQYFDWNVSSGDAGGTTSTEAVVNNVISGVQNKSYSVVLQHDIKKFSVDAVEEIIIWGLNNGYSFSSLNMTSPAVHHGVNN